ncbi:HDOD domain-containing protein [Arcobacter sp. LA11]|uniref:HDOD domain-containing protein n=1 Tax=Arcobacter sp. LA11 TaxID=1898176 RepID=UPI000934D6A1|nr:HDOD domain-containing protein [Arcobacter sp. LA11]
MNESIIEKIESLPPLPKTITEIEEFRQSSEKEAFELLKIIEKDALIVSTLLKVSNSAMFGFRSKVETASKAINLLGINFTISIAIGGTVQNLLKTNLSVYGINSDDFMRASNLATTLTSMWLTKVSFDLKEELVLPALLQEAGKFILADVIDSEGKTEEFKTLLSSGKTLAEAEKEVSGMTTSQITASIFKHWKLSDNLINVIEFVDDIENCDSEYENRTEILDVIKTICNITDPLSEENIQKGIAKATRYGLDVKNLESAVEKLQDRLLDE